MLKFLKIFINILKNYLTLLLKFESLIIYSILYMMLPKRLGNRKRKLERENFNLVFSRLTPKEFRKQTGLSRRSFNFLLNKIQVVLPKKV